MASAPPIGQQYADRTVRLPHGRRRAWFLVVCAFLALVAIAIGMIIAGTNRPEPAAAMGTAISDQSVVATPLPNVLTPTPLANTPVPTIAPTAPPPPTAIAPTSAPPRVVAPLVQPAPANVAPAAPSKPHDDGKGKGKGKGKDD